MNKKTIFIINDTNDTNLVTDLATSLAQKSIFRLDEQLPISEVRNYLSVENEDKLTSALLTKYLNFSNDETSIVLSYANNPLSIDINKKICDILCGFAIVLVNNENYIDECQLRFGDRFLGFISTDTKSSKHKLSLGIAGNIDTAKIKSALASYQYLVPEIFRHSLFVNAKKNYKKICLPESLEPRILAAAKHCEEEKIAKCVLLGDREEIFAKAKASGISLPDSIAIIPLKPTKAHISRLVELRKAKGMTEDKAIEALKEPIMLATMLVDSGEVDGIVAGVSMTTAKTITPAFQIIKTKPNVSLVSGLFFMCLPDKLVLFADCAVNPTPSPEQLADIALQSAETARKFGMEPRVSMLSFSTINSASGPEVDRIKQALEIARNKDPKLMIDGPLQYDASTDPKTGKQKAPDSQVAGRANVFVFPSLDAGNIGYKIAQRTSNSICIGPVLQGLNKPVNDLSRGALVDDIIYTIAITCIQA